MTQKNTGTIAEQLAALKAYRSRPEEVVEPLKSNWTVVPANDNASVEEIADYSFERHLRVTPSVQEIMRQVDEGPVVYGEVALDDDGNPVTKHAPIVAIGKLKFSDGTQTEKVHKTGPDGDVVQVDKVMTPGAMLHMREKAEGPAGGKGFNEVDLHNSALFYADAFKTELPRFIKRGDRRNGTSMTAAQSRVNLDAAIANTKVMPPVTICPPALPCGTAKVSDNFIGFKTASSGQSGSVAWEDIGQTIENAKVWANLRRALKAKDIDVLDAAMSAQNYEDVGMAAGQSRLYAKYNRGGKRALIAANDNLVAAMNKNSSGSI